MKEIEQAHEMLKKQPRIILSEEFAYRVNDIVGEIPDETLLATLFGPWHSMVNHRGGDHPAPPESWVEFMESLNRMEQSQLSCLVDRTMWRQHVKTLGELREFAELKGSFRGVGPRGKAFEQIAFQKPLVNNTVPSLI